MKLKIVIAVFVLLTLLHQDFWNWDSPSLVLGFIPIGLFYHALYSLVAAGFWALVIKYVWPVSVEKWAEETDHGYSS